MNRLDIAAIILLVFNGFSALVGGFMLVVDSTGDLLQIPLSILEHSPFKDFTVPGIFLLVFNGFSSLLIASAVIKRYGGYHLIVSLQGMVSMIWIVMQVLMIREAVLLQYMYGGIGLGLFFLGILLNKSSKQIKMNVYLLLAHPNKTSFNGQLANAYEESLLKKGHQVRRQNLGEMHFDPVLWRGYAAVQELEADLIQAQENIVWCNKWVIIYPVWWGSVPGLFKGFIDRTLLPGFAFKYHQKDPFWDKYLVNKSAHVITTSDAPGIWLWWQYGNSDMKTVKKAMLEFCGIKPVRFTRIGRIKYLDEKQRRHIIEKVIRNC